VVRSRLAVVIGCGAVALAACGSSGRSSAALDRACQNLSAVLSDGPDPAADPVGYAEAQILPLRQVHTDDPTLQQAVRHLDAAYQETFETDGAPTAERAVDSASARLDAICPGAAP